MDHRETERFIAHMADMQPRVPEWCKAEHMELRVPQKELWRCESNNHSNMIKRSIKSFFGRQKRREVNP